MDDMEQIVRGTSDALCALCIIYGCTVPSPITISGFRSLHAYTKLPPHVISTSVTFKPEKTDCEISF